MNRHIVAGDEHACLAEAHCGRISLIGTQARIGEHQYASFSPARGHGTAINCPVPDSVI